MSFVDELLKGKINFGGAGGDGSEGGGIPPKAKKVRKHKGSTVGNLLISLAVTIVFGCIYFYVQLPAINIHSGDFYWFIFWLLVVFMAALTFLDRFRVSTEETTKEYARRKLFIPLIIVGVLILVVVIGSVIGMKIFRAGAYASLLEFESGTFSEEVEEVDWSRIPMLDEDSANTLANRRLGEISDLVSQFEVNDSSTQINYQGKPVRVIYLNYGDFFKWFNNQSEGIPAYMIIDMTTQEVTVERLEEGIKYSPSEYFNHKLIRHLRFKYPTKMFDSVNFEIDEEGTPYWVASVVEKKIGLFSGTDIVGAVLCNAITGECTYCEAGEIPSWVDRVYSASLLIEQYDYHGLYVNGFINSIFGQTDCTATTEGYNYIAMDDDVWMYTGITSVTSDAGNIGFILINQRTKEAHYYSCAGAEEYSAMSSAEGAVQQYQYSATFPLLLNIEGEASYFMALKDDAELVKMYSIVNVQQYQIVATGTSLSATLENYINLLVENGILDQNEADDYLDSNEGDTGNVDSGSNSGGETEETTVSVSGTITEIRSANIDGNTIFYLKIDEGETYYSVSAKDYPEAVLLNVGDSVKLEAEDTDGTIAEIKRLE